MRKRINYRFALYLMLTVAALGTCTHFLHAYQVRRNASSLKDRANQFRQQGDLAKTAEYLGQYIGMNPTDIDALCEYALLLGGDQLAKSPQSKVRALLTLERALVRDPGRNDVRRRSAQVAMAIGQYAVARENVQYLNEALSKKDPEVVLMLAKCLDALSDAKGARRAYEDAIKIARHELDAYARLAALLRRHTADVLSDKETAAQAEQLATKVMNEMVHANQDSYRAYLLRAAYSRTFPGPAGSDPKARAADVAKDVAKAEELAPEAADVLLMAAELAAPDRVDEARKKLLRCCELHPKDWRSYAGLARLDAKDGKTDVAVAYLDRGLAQVPESVELLWDRAKLLTAAGRGTDAEKSIELLRNHGFPAADVDVLRGRILMKAERWNEAGKLLAEAYDPLVTRADRLKDEAAGRWAEQAGLWLGECYEQIGNVGRAHTIYSRVVARNSQSIAGRVGVATTRWRQGRLQDALEQYRVLMRLPGRPDGGWADVARLVMLLNLEREEGRRNWDEVEDALKLAEQLEPLPTSVAILRADYHANRKELDKARHSLQNRYPDEKSRPTEIWVALAALEEWQGEPAKALAILDGAQRISGDKVELRVAKANHLVRHGQDKAREALLALADNAGGFAETDRRRLFRGLAAAYGQARLTAKAAELWQWLAEKLPGDLQSRIALFELAASAGDVHAMERWQKDIQKIEGDDGVMWRHARIAAVLASAQQGDLSGLGEARSLLGEMAARRPEWSNVPLIGARISDFEKRADDALSSYMRAIQLGARDPAALARTYNLLVERGRLDDANRVARMLPDSTASAPDNQRALGEVALRANDFLRAEKMAESVVAAAPNDYRSFLLSGQTHWAAGRVEAAEKDFRKARELARSEPATWLTLVQFLIATKRTEPARAEADAAEGVLRGPKGLSALARINVQVGRADRASDLFRAAVAAAGDDADVVGPAALYYLTSGRHKEADELLRRLSESPDRNWAAQARYLRAATLAGRGGSDALVQEALALIDAPGVDLSVAEKVQQKRARAHVLALQPFRNRRREAARILEDLIDQQVATPADQLLAAQLYESVDDLAKARVRYSGLLTMPGGDTPAILAAAGRFLVQNGDLHGAGLALRGLENQSQQAVAAKVLRARLFHAEGQTAKAVALLLECADEKGTDRSAVAGVLEDLGQFGDAEAQLRKFVASSQHAEDTLKLAYYLIRRQRFAEALDLCDGAWAKCPPVAVAETCLIALSQMPSNPSSVDRVAARVEAAILKSPDEPALLGALAAVRNFQGRFDAAEALYRRILEKDPRQSTALNNLAWLLALKGGHANEALKLVNLAVDLTGPNPTILDTRAVASLGLNQPAAGELAVQDLDVVIAESPSPTAYFHLAQAHLLAGRKREALQAWRKANEGAPLKPESVHPLERSALERLFEVLGRPS
jgi:tetratricopeptide (TPR) repeat protein